MTNSAAANPLPSILASQAGMPPAVLFGDSEIDLWPYRSRTVALLRRYSRASVEIGRLPSLMGRQVFRSRVTSYSMGSFEDVVIFVADMERTIDKLDTLEKKFVALYVLEEYTFLEVSRIMLCSERTAERLVHDAVDALSRLLLEKGLLEKLPEASRGVTRTKQESYVVS